MDGIICTDAGALGNMVNPAQLLPDLPHAAAGAVKAGINQFLDRHLRQCRERSAAKGLLTEKDIDDVLKSEFRVMIKLGMLDPPERVTYTRSRAMRKRGNWATTRLWRNKWRLNRWCCSRTRTVCCRSTGAR